jgi:CheY-like chemotaxis protein
MISKHTILYAEDDIDDLFIVREAFEKHDHIQVVHAPNGKEALRELEQMSEAGILPCLIILDINMPVMNGRETLERIRNQSEFGNIPVVLFSTSNSNTDRDFAARWHTELIVKPVNYSNLEMIAREFVSRCNFEVSKLSTANKN